jgi:hypothetical protein
MSNYFYRDGEPEPNPEEALAELRANREPYIPEDNRSYGPPPEVEADAFTAWLEKWTILDCLETLKRVNQFICDLGSDVDEPQLMDDIYRTRECIRRMSDQLDTAQANEQMAMNNAKRGNDAAPY